MRFRFMAVCTAFLQLDYNKIYCGTAFEVFTFFARRKQIFALLYFLFTFFTLQGGFTALFTKKSAFYWYANCLKFSKFAF